MYQTICCCVVERHWLCSGLNICSTQCFVGTSCNITCYKRLLLLMVTIGVASELEYNWDNSGFIRRRWSSATMERYIIVVYI